MLATKKVLPHAFDCLDLPHRLVWSPAFSMVGRVRRRSTEGLLKFSP